MTAQRRRPTTHPNPMPKRSTASSQYSSAKPVRKVQVDHRISAPASSSWGAGRGGGVRAAHGIHTIADARVGDARPVLAEREGHCCSGRRLITKIGRLACQSTTTSRHMQEGMKRADTQQSELEFK